ncbi:T9SS type A sorting domain-containing protein [Flavicella sediminum]|uniref:T9SS type A sorting domain-containing protein n=1 Tax=Flavicella sediminum TaxID=2585141 RepID=UPI0011223911|nr:T9SS type A sorting domain-containing protein [Flavicella sediminum]
MKKITFLSILLVALFSLGTVNAQTCTEAQTDQANFVGKRTKDALFIGQSFQACDSGKLTSVTVKFAGQSDQAAGRFRVYSGKPSTVNGQENIIADNQLYDVAISDFPIVGGASGGTAESEYTVTLSTDVILVSGNDYTFTFHKPATGAARYFRLKSDNTSPNYANGTLVGSVKLPGSTTNNDDVDLTFSYITDTTLNVSNEEVAEESSVYPNPSTGLVHVSGVDANSLEIFNVAGQKVLSANGNSIDARSLASGNYFLKIHTNEGAIVKQIIIN